MSLLAQPSLKSLIARRKPFYSLEAPFYTSPEIFEADMALIFGRHWIFVAVEPDVPEPGDAMTVDIGRQSVVIVRDDDMQIHAFHNVCRHRGAKLVNTPKAMVGNLVCPYHSWTYNLQGDLIFAEHMGKGFDKSCHGLKPVALKNLAGLLFICLSDDPPGDFDEMAAVMEPYIRPHDLANAKVAAEVDLIEPGNWKLTMENNRECYHCAGNHPELTIPLFEYGFGFAPDEVDDARLAQIARYDSLIEGLACKWEARGVPSRLVEHLDDMVTGYRSQRLPIDQSGESQTLDTKVACRKLLGSFNDPQAGGLHFWTQPNSWHHFMSDHVVSFAAIPLDAERTLVKTKWLVHKDAVEGVDYDVENLTGVWNATNQQDSDLVGLAQAGARSAGYEPGPYSPYTEELVEKFCTWYLGRLGAHLEEAR